MIQQIGKVKQNIVKSLLGAIWSPNYHFAIRQATDFDSHTMYVREIAQVKYVWQFSPSDFDVFIPSSWQFISIYNIIKISYIHYTYKKNR